MFVNAKALQPLVMTKTKFVGNYYARLYELEEVSKAYFPLSWVSHTKTLVTHEMENKLPPYATTASNFEHPLSPRCRYSRPSTVNYSTNHVPAEDPMQGSKSTSPSLTNLRCSHAYPHQIL